MVKELAVARWVMSICMTWVFFTNLAEGVTFPLDVSYTMDSSRKITARMAFTLSNPDQEPVHAWACEFDLPPDCTITSFWHAQYSVKGTHVRVTNPSWWNDKILVPGAGYTFGLVLAFSGGIPPQVHHLQALGNTVKEPPSLVAPAAPVLHPIENFEQKGDYTVAWSSCSGANFYVLTQGKDPMFTDETIMYEGNELSQTFKKQARGTYYYKVYAHNPIGYCESEEVQQTIVLDSPPIDAPFLAPITNPAKRSIFTLQWTRIDNATSYTVEESAGADDFQNASIVYKGPHTLFTLTDKEEGVYYYRIKASDALNESEPSNVASSRVEIDYL